MSITGYAGMLNLQGLSLQLSAPDDVYAGISAPFNLRISNRKRRMPGFMLEVCHGDATVTIPWLSTKGSADAVLSLLFPERGRARIDSVQIRSPFPVNFFVRSWRLPVQCDFLVFPKPIPCSPHGVGDDGELRDSGSRERRGSGGEVERIVDYTGREPLKQIHWKLSARADQFKVKEHSEPAAQPLMIELAALPGGLEEQVSGAAWLVRQWGLQRPVGLLLGDERIEPLQGRRQIRQLLAALSIYGK